MISAIHGLVEDLEEAAGRILRPRDAKGNLMPVTEVGISMDWQSVSMLAFALVIGVAGGNYIARKLP